MENGMLDRINELYHKEQAEGLTEEEQEEQAALRKAYLSTFRRNLKSQLDNIDIENPDGSVENLKEAHERSIQEALGLTDSDPEKGESNLEDSSDNEE